MSEKSGLFVNKKADAPAAASGSPAAPGKKDVSKRWKLVALGVGALVVVAATTLAPPAPEAHKKEAPTALINTSPSNADKKAFEAKYQQDITVARQQAEKAQQDAQALRQEMAELRDAVKSGKGTGTALPPGVTPPPSMNANETPAQPTPPAPPLPPVPVPGANTSGKPPAPSSGADLPPPMHGTQAPSAGPRVFEAPKESAAEAKAAQDVLKAQVTYKKNPNAGLVPAGAFAPIFLLNGLDAGTSTAAQSNPTPVLVNVEDNANLPGSAKYNLKNCFVLGTGYGDMSAERVYVRFSRLSCVDKKDRLILSQEVAGYLVDSDGKVGMRGKVFDRQGAKIGKALIAGFAQGLSGALGSAQSTVTSSVVGETTSISGGSALRASGLGGAQTAAGQLAQWYLKEAQSIFPVIGIDSGRKGTLVFTSSVSLAWGETDTQFTKDVKPGT